eukprot:g2458.t1
MNVLGATALVSKAESIVQELSCSKLACLSTARLSRPWSDAMTLWVYGGQQDTHLADMLADRHAIHM